MPPRTMGFALSLALHVLALVVAVSNTPMYLWRIVRVTKVSVDARQAHASTEDAPDAADAIAREHDPRSMLVIQGFEFDFARVQARETDLFPFLSLRLPLNPQSLLERRTRARTRLFNPFASGTPVDPNPPLVLSDRALQDVVDSAWSRRYRWRVFRPVRELTAKYSADAGRLPMLLRRYNDENMLQPYLDTGIPDMRLWTELGIAADHVDYIGFISRYASAHPSTKATTELLFLLDKLAQGSYDALLTLLNARPFHVEWTRATSRDAFELLMDAQRYYRAQLQVRHLDGAGDLRLFYDRIRLAILTGIVATTPQGYRTNDARFLVGAIYWRQAREDDALRWWREMTIDPADGHAAAIAAVVDAVRRAGPGGERIDRGAINGALDAEQRAWVEFWRARLDRFGYAFDTY